MSIAASSVTLFSTICFCLLSYAEQDRAVRPSSLLNILLLATLLFDIACARTLWLRSVDGLSYAIACVSTAAVGLKSFILVLEAVEKTHLLLPKYLAYPPEAVVGIYNRSFFWWLNSLFRRGFGRVLGVEDLFPLDKHLEASYLHNRFQTAWASGMIPLSDFFFKVLFLSMSQKSSSALPSA